MESSPRFSIQHSDFSISSLPSPYPSPGVPGEGTGCGFRIFCWVVLIALLVPGPLRAAEAEVPKAAVKAARSVHLHWLAPEGTEFYNEMSVEKSTRGTYFMACGFNHGYFGMQELAGKGGLAGDNGKSDKVVIFSIWDTHLGDNPKAVPEDQKVEVLYHADDVRIGRFGGEGTGAQSFFTYPWKIGETCRYFLRAKIEGEKTSYTAYFFLNESKTWKRLATFRTITQGKALGGYYSFIEDFRRDGKSAAEVREAVYGNGWVKTIDSNWVSLTRARFTGDRTPTENIDAGLRGGRFFLTTGGDVQNKVKLKETITRPPGDVALPD